MICKTINSTLPLQVAKTVFVITLHIEFLAITIYTLCEGLLFIVIIVRTKFSNALLHMQNKIIHQFLTLPKPLCNCKSCLQYTTKIEAFFLPLRDSISLLTKYSTPQKHSPFASYFCRIQKWIQKKYEQTAIFKLEDDKLLTFKFHCFLVNLWLLFVTEGSVNDETLLYLVLLIKKKKYELPVQLQIL